MKKIFILLGILLLFLALSLVNKWHWQALQKNLPENTLSPIVSEEKTQETYKQFVSLDKDFQISYPAAWFVLDDNRILSAFNSNNWAKIYNLKTIFLTQNILGGSFAQLMVQKGIFDIGTDKILQKMVDDSEKQGVEMEVINSNIIENGLIFEAKYSSNSQTLSSQEVILLKETGGGYLVSVMAAEANWPEFATSAAFIINSAQLLTER